jgi:hypothetical protein
MATHKLVKVNADSEIVFGEGIFDEVNKLITLEGLRIVAQQ